MPRTATQATPSDPNVVSIIAEGFTRGLSQKAIAGRLSIATRTLVEWQTNGHRELEDYNSGDLQELGSLGRLSAEVGKAYYDFESRKIDRVEAGGADWVAALAHVTRRNPQDWAERRYEHVQQDIRTVSVSVALTSLPEQQLLALVRDKLDQGTPLLPPPPGSPEIEPHGGSEAETTPTP